MAEKEGNLLPLEVALNGKFQVVDDAATIGANFSKLENLRYSDTSLRGIMGMTKINTSTTALGNNTLIRSAFHFTKYQPAETHLLIAARDSTAVVATKIFDNTTAIPNQGNFSATTLYTDTTLNTNANIFSDAPGGQVAYCDGVDTCIWGGNEMRVSGFMVYESSSAVFSYDYTEVVNNTINDASNRATLQNAPRSDIYIGSTRPLKGFNLYMAAPNTAAATMAVNYWDGTAWAAVTNLSDGTFLAGKTLGQTGSVTFDSTETTAKLREFEGRIIYWYKVVPSALSAGVTIYYATANAPFQTIKDIPDGADRTIMACAKFTTAYEDNSVNVAEDIYSSNDTATFMDVSSLTTATQYIVAGFLEPMMGMRLHIPSSYTNATASTMTVSYWNGTAWTAVSGLQDGTASGGASLGKSGLVAWTPIAFNTEFKTEIISFSSFIGFMIPLLGYFQDQDPIMGWIAAILSVIGYLIVGYHWTGPGESPYDESDPPETDTSGNLDTAPGSSGDTSSGDSGTGYNIETSEPSGNTVPDLGKLFWYKISFSATLDASTRIYYVGGIPAPKKMLGYSVPMFSQDRLWLLDEKAGKRNKAICSNTFAPDVWNGEDTVSFFFGDESPLTAGGSLSFQLGSSIANVMFFFKQKEMWAVVGNGPSDWTQYRVSSSIGCVAPHSVKNINLPTSAQTGQGRQVLVWQAVNGVYMFDGRTIYPLHSDIDSIFGKTTTTLDAVQGQTGTASRDKMARSVIFIDPRQNELHWLYHDINGAAASYLNKEFVYDYKRHKWYEVIRGASANQQLVYGLTVVDTNGAEYTYGCMNTGYVERLDNGTDFDGVDITHIFQTGGMLLYKGSTLYQTRIRGIKLIQRAKTITANDTTIGVYTDGSSTPTTATFDPANSAGNRISDVYHVTAHNTGIFHAIRGTMVTDDEYTGFEPLFLGVWYEVMRPDMS